MTFTGRLFEIALPTFKNDGGSYAIAHAKYRAWLLQQFSGYTMLPAANGAWRDPASGRVYRDRMIVYRVLWPCTDEPDLLSRAFELFPDQIALYVSKIGTAEIVPHPIARSTRNAEPIGDSFTSAG